MQMRSGASELWAGRSDREVAVSASCRLRRFVTFLAFGCVAALANLATGWLLYGIRPFPGLPYWGATAAAAGVGLSVSFSLNYYFNFNYRGRSARHQFQTFCLVSLLGLMLTSGFASGFLMLFEHYFQNGLSINGFAINLDFGAHFMAVGLVAAYSYPAHEMVTFNVGVRARIRELKLALGR